MMGENTNNWAAVDVSKLLVKTVYEQGAGTGVVGRGEKKADSWILSPQ